MEERCVTGVIMNSQVYVCVCSYLRRGGSYTGSPYVALRPYNNAPHWKNKDGGLQARESCKRVTGTRVTDCRSVVFDATAFCSVAASQVGFCAGDRARVRLVSSAEGRCCCGPFFVYGREHWVLPSGALEYGA